MMRLPAVFLKLAFFLTLVTATTALGVTDINSRGLPARAGLECKAVLERPMLPMRELSDIKKFRMIEINADRLALEPNEASSEVKEQWKVQALGKEIRELNPDFGVIEEVRDLKKFSKEYLADRYNVFQAPGNDPNGFEIGFIVKKDIPMTTELFSFRHITWFDPVESRTRNLFNRDVPTLVMRRKDDPHGKPFLILLGNHAKAMRDRPGDPKSMIQRTAQYQKIEELIRQLRAKYGFDVPMMMAGDFNADLRDAAEVQGVLRPMRDSFALAGIHENQRATFQYHMGNAVVGRQLDGVLMSPNLSRSVLAARTQAYRERRANERGQMETASDHSLVVVDVSTEIIFPEAH